MSPVKWTQESFEIRFWESVEPTGFCWLWTSYCMKNGYGQTSKGAGKKVYPHRVAYELLVGQIPEGLVLDHLCRVRNCVNPDHLEPVTSAENTRRGKEFYRKYSRPTHCRNGHLYTPENTLRSRKTARSCRTCYNISSLAGYYRRR